MSNSNSNSLFHFTKSSDILQNILKNGFLPRYSLEDATWSGLTTLEFVAFPMVCFCDIPLERINEHVGFYGSYGLGLSREWAIRNGLNPIFYLSKSSSLGSNFLSSLKAAVVADKTKPKDNHTTPQLHIIMAHMKPLSGTMVVAGKPVNKDFYHESEWRFVPNINDVPLAISQTTYNKETKMGELNNALESKAMLAFTPEDVRYIFVKGDADIPPLVDFMNSQLSHISVASMKILMTRITSLEHIAKDI